MGKKIAVSLAVLLLSVALLAGWVLSWLDFSEQTELPASQVQDIAYLQQIGEVPPRGRILAIVTSTATMTVPTADGSKQKKAGFELTELARAYYVFMANGFAVDIASPIGGAAPYVQDDDDMGPYDYAFLNDPAAMAKVRQSLPLRAVDATAYQAVYLVGGKGTMFDFPNNAALQQLLAASWQQGAVIAAVCHGPAALLNVKLPSGDYLLQGRQLTAFTNEEELFLIPRAAQVFPGGLLQDQLQKRGARFQAGPRYLAQLVQDGRLLSGQNPWSVWPLADAVVQALGVTPKSRAVTPEEQTVDLLGVYQREGLAAAQQWLAKSAAERQPLPARNLLAIHAYLAFHQADIRHGVALLRLLRQSAQLVAAAPPVAVASTAVKSAVTKEVP